MKKHPEQQDGEIHLGNTTVDDFHKSSWNSKRMGNLARYAGGRPIDARHMFESLYPWFIARSEVEAKILSIGPDAPNREERIRTYQSMLADGGVL